MSFTIGKRSGHMRVGVACVPLGPKVSTTQLVDSWYWDAFSGALHRGGKIQHHNLAKFVPTTWETGDKIDMHLDCEARTLTCYKAGAARVGVLATDVQRPAATHTGAQIRLNVLFRAQPLKSTLGYWRAHCMTL